MQNIVQALLSLLGNFHSSHIKNVFVFPSSNRENPDLYLGDQDLAGTKLELLLLDPGENLGSGLPTRKRGFPLLGRCY